jgi:hypothetical protein
LVSARFFAGHGFAELLEVAARDAVPEGNSLRPNDPPDCRVLLASLGALAVTVRQPTANAIAGVDAFAFPAGLLLLGKIG